MQDGSSSIPKIEYHSTDYILPGGSSSSSLFAFSSTQSTRENNSIIHIDLDSDDEEKETNHNIAHATKQVGTNDKSDYDNLEDREAIDVASDSSSYIEIIDVEVQDDDELIDVSTDGDSDSIYIDDDDDDDSSESQEDEEEEVVFIPFEMENNKYLKRPRQAPRIRGRIGHMSFDEDSLGSRQYKMKVKSNSAVKLPSSFLNKNKKECIEKDEGHSSERYRQVKKNKKIKNQYHHKKKRQQVDNDKPKYESFDQKFLRVRSEIKRKSTRSEKRRRKLLLGMVRSYENIDGVIRFDGGYRRQTKQASAAYAIWKGDSKHENESKPIVTGYQLIKCNNSDAAECHAIILGLKRAKQLGLKSVRIEGDSLNTIDFLKAGEKRKIKSYHMEAWRLLDEFETYSLHHIYREDNTVTDKLCNEAMNSDVSANHNYSWNKYC